MATFTEVVAAVVVQSSAMALSHFGVSVEMPQVDRAQPAVERTIARTPRKIGSKVSDCPDAQRARVVKV
jgi:hypothetical protein